MTSARWPFEQGFAGCERVTVFEHVDSEVPRVCSKSRFFPVGHWAALALREPRGVHTQSPCPRLGCRREQRARHRMWVFPLGLPVHPCPQHRKPVSPHGKCRRTQPFKSVHKQTAFAQPRSGFLGWSALGFDRDGWRGGAAWPRSVRGRVATSPASASPAAPGPVRTRALVFLVLEVSVLFGDADSPTLLCGYH